MSQYLNCGWDACLRYTSLSSHSEFKFEFKWKCYIDIRWYIYWYNQAYLLHAEDYHCIYVDQFRWKCGEMQELFQLKYLLTNDRLINAPVLSHGTRQNNLVCLYTAYNGFLSFLTLFLIYFYFFLYLKNFV